MATNRILNRYSAALCLRWTVVGAVGRGLGPRHLPHQAEVETPAATHVRKSGFITVPEESVLLHCLVPGEEARQTVRAPFAGVE